MVAKTAVQVLAGVEDLLMRGAGDDKQTSQTRKSGSIPITALSIALVVPTFAELATALPENAYTAIVNGIIYNWDTSVTVDDGVNAVVVASTTLTGAWVINQKDRFKNVLGGLGTTLEDATQLISGVNQVISVPANSGVRLPTLVIGEEVTITNENTGTAVKVYPDISTHSLTGLGIGVAYTLPVLNSVKYRAVSSTHWMLV